MIIQASAMDMASKRTYRSAYGKKETLNTWGEGEMSSDSKIFKNRMTIQYEEKSNDYESAMKKIRRNLFDYLFRILLGIDSSKMETEGPLILM